MVVMQTTNKKTFFDHLFYLFMVCITFVLQTSCGVRKDLIPSQNKTLGQLPKQNKKAYQKLYNLLDEASKEKLERSVNKIQDVDALCVFIETNLRAQQTYQTLRTILPKGKRAQLMQAVQNADQLEVINTLIQESAALDLQSFQACSLETQQNCMDLLHILPKEQAHALKEAISNCTGSIEVEALIKSKLPHKLQVLDVSTKQAFIKLPEAERKAILVKALQEEHNASKLQGNIPLSKQEDLEQADPLKSPIASQATNDPKHQATGAPSPLLNDPNAAGASDSTSTMPPSFSGLDLERLVMQTEREGKAQPAVDVPQDTWGTKLPLQGQAREHFLDLVLQFSHSDQAKLKELFDKAKSISIRNFLSVYDTGFKPEESVALVGTMIYLYKGWPDLTLKLCNNPHSLSTGDKLIIFRKTSDKQLKLLTRLNQLLSE
jgi:hypothetical protein